MYDRTSEKNRKETELDQKYTPDGNLTQHKEKKIEITRVSTVSEIIQVAMVGIVGIFCIVFIFMVAIGGVKLLNNAVNNVEVQQ